MKLVIFPALDGAAGHWNNFEYFETNGLEPVYDFDSSQGVSCFQN
jgi:hypothetical protein